MDTGFNNVQGFDTGRTSSVMGTSVRVASSQSSHSKSRTTFAPQRFIRLSCPLVGLGCITTTTTNGATSIPGDEIGIDLTVLHSALT